MAAQQPVLYTVQESMNLLSLDNMVSQCVIANMQISLLSQMSSETAWDRQLLVCSVILWSVLMCVPEHAELVARTTARLFPS